MKKPYFVMLRHPNGEYFLPLVDDDSEVVQFATADDAITGAQGSDLGHNVGFEVFDFSEGGL